MLPVIVLPFITLLFWLLGGDGGEQENQPLKKVGFNLRLPDANIKEDGKLNKMDYYDKAKLDSLKFQELIKNDPNYKAMSFQDSGTFGSVETKPYQHVGGMNGSIYNNGSSNDPNTAGIYRKLDELNREMNRSYPGSSAGINAGEYHDRSASSGTNADVQRLEEMMRSMQQSDTQDPELQQLNGMLENILDIQHPGRVKEKLQKKSATQRGKVFAVRTTEEDSAVSLLDGKSSASPKMDGFYSLDDSQSNSEINNAIQAFAHETQTVVNGSTIKLRLGTDIFINGILIPKDNFLYGVAALDGERLGIQINSIRYKNSLFPVELAVYDMDGLNGIFIPGAITRDVAKESAGRSLQNIGITSLDPSWGAQAAGAGIEAVKSLFGKRTKLIKVTIKAGYRILLQDENQKQSTNN